MASMAGASSGFSIQATSGMSWIMGRRPTSLESAASVAMDAAATELSKSTQPTTPAMNALSLRQLEQVQRFGDGGCGLHQHGRVDAGARQLRREVGRQVVTVDGPACGVSQP